MGAYFLAIILVAFAALSLWYGGAAALSDTNALRSRWLVNQWRDGTGPVYSPPLWQQTHDELQAALRVTPGNAQLLDDLGFLNAARAMGAGTPAVGTANYDLQQKLFADAVGNYRAATVLRPTFPYTWAYLALAKQLKGETDSELWSSFDKTLRYGRNEAGVQPAIARVAFAHWAGLSLERKTEIIAMINTAQPTPRKKLLDLAQQSGVVLPL